MSLHISGTEDLAAGTRRGERPGGLSVLVVDGHRLLAEAVARMLSTMEEVGSTFSVTSGTTALETARRARPDVVLVDDALGGHSPLELVRQLTADDGSRPAVLMFASCPEPALAVEALQCGASGWVGKDCQVGDLRRAILTVSAGQRWLAQDVLSGVVDLLLRDRHREPADSPLTALSARQREVLACLTSGLTHAATAARLRVSPNTVRTHVRTMCQVLDVHSTPALVALARRWGFAPVTAVPDRSRPS